MKLLALSQTLIGVEPSKLEQSKEWKSTKYCKELNKGYIDEDNFYNTDSKETNKLCIEELVKIGLVEQRKVVFRSENVSLIRLSRNGFEFLKFLENL